MYDEDSVNNILEALTLIANQSLKIKLLNDSVGGEVTRIMNIYLKYITPDMDEKSKDVWKKANQVLQQCEVINSNIVEYKTLIQELLNLIADS